MSKESWKVFLACALGAGIGSLVALELNQWLWWIGLIVGGLIGYFSYEWHAVVRAIPAAWKATGGVGGLLMGCAAMGLAMMSLVWAFFWVILPIVIIGGLAGGDLNSAPAWAVTIIALLCLMSVAVNFIVLILSLTPPIGADNSSPFEKALKANWRLFPLIVVFVHLPRGMHWLWGKAPRFIRFCKCLGWEFFIRIHSERRLLCGFDAMLGAGVGYFAGSAIIGALAGGVFGLINYAVVTKRILEPHGFLSVR